MTVLRGRWSAQAGVGDRIVGTRSKSDRISQEKQSWAEYRVAEMRELECGTRHLVNHPAQPTSINGGIVMEPAEASREIRAADDLRIKAFLDKDYVAVARFYSD